jgi:hypothetical protein
MRAGVSTNYRTPNIALAAYQSRLTSRQPICVLGSQPIIGLQTVRWQPHVLTANMRAVVSQSTYIYRVPQCMSPRWNWDSPTPLAASECALPPGPKGGGAHSPVGKGVGESQFQRLEKRLALCLLCAWSQPIIGLQTVRWQPHVLTANMRAGVSTNHRIPNSALAASRPDSQYACRGLNQS